MIFIPFDAPQLGEAETALVDEMLRALGGQARLGPASALLLQGPQKAVEQISGRE